ncbi:MAG: hypothetical protein J7513_08065 [Solirubrobacteraceae bacterium]|nr:hypothetical protein [Solirubrobacteraceae bacterium]
MTHLPLGGLSQAAIDELELTLAPVDAWAERRYPGGATTDQPVHTVYVPADRAEAGLCAAWGAEALETLDANAPLPALLAEATGLEIDEVAGAWDLLHAVLAERPIQDLRVDLEDGYGAHPDEVEDEDAARAARVLLAEAAAPGRPMRLGIRHRSLERSTRARAVRTLERVISGLASGGGVPDGFVLTLPKVIDERQVLAYVRLLGALESGYGLAPGSLRFEIQVETPQAILAADGRLPLAPMLDAGEGRITGLHFGTYDYTAAMGVGAAHQRAQHPVAQTAKAVMRLAAAGTGVEVSDGSTNRLPVGDLNEVYGGWRVHADLVGGAIADGVRQGWDLHPAQLVTRHLVNIATSRRKVPDALARLAVYFAATAGGGAQSADDGATLDEPATAQALAADLVRALHLGATTVTEVESRTGVPVATLHAFAARRVA